jgi:hypothetical protein
MKQFTNTDPNTIDDDSRIILKFYQPRFNGKGLDYYYLLKDDDYLLWVSKSLFHALNGNPEEWLAGTDIEFPKQGLPWFIKSIEEKFMKTEAEGGLKKEAFTYSEIINGEKLITLRWFGTPGYALANDSRQSYIFKTIEKRQEFCFTDSMLFDHGLFEKLKKIADKISAGSL